MTVRWKQVSSKVGRYTKMHRHTRTHAHTHTQTATERCNCNACAFQGSEKILKMDLNQE